MFYIAPAFVGISGSPLGQHGRYPAKEKTMRYLRTKLSTTSSPTEYESVPASSFLEGLLDRFDTNPNYKHSLVTEWFVEFGDDDYPWREIGLGLDGVPVFSGPNDEDYGYWLDTNMKYDDFEGTEITAEEFEEKWVACAVLHGKRP